MRRGKREVQWGWNHGLIWHFVYVTKSNIPDLATFRSGGTTYVMRILSDQIGSMRRLVQVGSGGGVWLDTSFDAFGVATTWPSPSANWPSPSFPFGFAGGLWDPDTGLYRFGARDYNPWEATWWSKDPIRFGGGLNLYAYCGNDPVNCTDPSGKSFVDYVDCLLDGGDPLECYMLLFWGTGTWWEPDNDSLETQADPRDELECIEITPDEGERLEKCRQNCHNYMRPGARYKGSNGRVYKNDRYGNWPRAYDACVQDCMGRL